MADEKIDKLDSKVIVMRERCKEGEDEKEENEIVAEFTRETLEEMAISAIGVDDEMMEAGRDDETEDGDPDEDIIDGTPLPNFDEDRLQEVLSLQEGDRVIEECKKYLRGELEVPDKREAILLEADIQKFLRHKNNFKITTQGVLVRIWLNKDSTINTLIVVGANQLTSLITQHHTFSMTQSSNMAHLGMRKTMNLLSKKFFAFGM